MVYPCCVVDEQDIWSALKTERPHVLLSDTDRGYARGRFGAHMCGINSGDIEAFSKHHTDVSAKMRYDI